MDTNAALPRNEGTERPLLLPSLRRDLGILPGAPGEDGAPTWLLYDPLQNRYYRMGRAAFVIISAWEAGAEASRWLEELRRDDPSIEAEDLRQVLHFLVSSGLTVATTAQDDKRLNAGRKKGDQGLLKWLLTHYLYIRIPLFRPDRFLGATLPWVEVFFRPVLHWLVLCLGVAGILLVIRQWDVFMVDLLHFFNLKGALFFGLTLFSVKAVHELGHAYTAKRQGCRVPTMGVAFLVLYPFLYTDTTDAWRLPSRKQRLAIVTAGVKTELALALLATFAWSFLEGGVLRSMAFFVATTSWVASLSINMSPFMRFDGYYALADWLGAENLQQRAFALARWHIRELLFGLKAPPPEALSPRRRRIFLTYAYATFVYRFLLFMGIALLVYHAVFKALGVILFFVEIGYFILMPLKDEIVAWWRDRRKMSLNRRTLMTVLILLSALFIFLFPWQGRLHLPAVLEAELKTNIFPHEDARIDLISIEEGQWVDAGQALFRLVLPELEKNRAMLERRVLYLQTRIDRHIGSAYDLDQLDILQGEMAETKANIAGIARRIEQGVVRAPHAGRVARMVQAQPHRWVSGKTLLAQIVGEGRTHITAYVQENQLHRVQEGVRAVFYSNGGDMAPVKAKVLKVYETAVSALTHPEAASIHGGPIAVRQAGRNLLKPEKALYKVIARAEAPASTLHFRMAGQLTVRAPSESFLRHFWRYAASVFIRESGL